MSKKKKVIIIVLIVFIIFVIAVETGNYFYRKHLRKVRIEVEQKVRLNRKITFEVYGKTNVKEIFSSEPISIIKIDKVDNKKLGIQKIKVKYKYDKYTFTSYINVEIVDTTKPIILSKVSYSLYKGENIDFLNYILSGDNYDENPTRKIIGE